MSERNGKKTVAVWSLTVLVLLLLGFCSFLLHANWVGGDEIERLRLELASVADRPPAAAIEVVGSADDQLATRLKDQLAAARREAAALRLQLDERDQAVAEQAGRQRERRPERGNPEPGNDGGPQLDMAARMERLKEENPQRYEEVQTWIKERQTRRSEGLQTQTDFLAAIEVKRLDADQLASHNLLLSKLEIIKDLNARMTNPGKDDDPQALRGQIRQETEGIRELLDKERKIVFQHLALDLGYDAGGAGEFSEYIEQVYRNTSIRNIPGGFPGGFPGSRRERDANPNP